MNAIFADSFYFFFLLNPRDTAHARARTFSQGFGGSLISTAWIFTELGDGLSAPEDREVFAGLLDRFTGDPLCRLVAPTAELFRAGADLFRSRPDKDWSLTDCISFVVMRGENLTDALTGDHHFTQAGFNALLAEPGR
ncbi:MAG: type II toxin-antitoxin system VapC family toxin [Tepidisphaerales bacterium]